MQKTKIILSLSLIGLLAATGPLSAATVTWTAATTISGDSDVSLTGTLNRAFNFGASGSPALADTTVNGVTFTAAAYNLSISQFPTMTNTVQDVGALSGASNNYGVSGTAYNSLTSQYQALLTSGIFAFTDAPLTLTLNGLTSGQLYQVQIWTNDSALNTGALRNTVLTGASNVSLQQNVQDEDGGVGQYAIGTFTADSSSQNIFMTGTGSSARTLINGFQLRAVPEPGVMPAAGLMGLWLATVARRRRHAQ